MEQSENATRPSSRRMTPIQCRVCHKIFFDNVQLVFHSESHLQGDLCALGGVGAASSRRGRDVAPNSSPSIEETDVPSPFPPPLSRSTNVRKRAGDHLTSCRPLAAINIICDLMGINRVRLNGQSGQRGGFSGYEQPRFVPYENPVPEIIVISDDDEEEDDNKKADEIDLTLRL